MSNHLKGILMVLSSTAMWGLVGILVQYLISSEHFTPEWLVNTRLLASGIILLAITYIFYERNIFKVLKTDFISYYRKNKNSVMKYSYYIKIVLRLKNCTLKAFYQMRA